MNRAIRWIVCAVLLALAPLLWFQGQANTTSPSGPLVTTNGFNLAELARAGLRVRQVGSTPTLSVTREALARARQAFAREPMAGNALFVLAVDERATDPRGSGSQALLTAAAALNKRNRHLGGLQLEQFSRQGDIASIFAVIDRLSRVHPELTSEFVQPLVQALRQDEALDVMADALESGPKWANAFWLAVPSDPAIVGRMYELRQRVDVGTDAKSDAHLMSGLVAAGRFDDAIALRNNQNDARSQGIGFVAVGGEPPFGWELEASGERAMTERGDAGYEVFVQRDTSGLLGRQLLVLPPGRYTFRATIAPLSAAGNVEARLQCATVPGVSGGQGGLDEPVVFTVPAGCRGWWLELSGDAWNIRDGLRVTLSNIGFEAVR